MRQPYRWGGACTAVWLLFLLVGCVPTAVLGGDRQPSGRVVTATPTRVGLPTSAVAAATVFPTHTFTPRPTATLPATNTPIPSTPSPTTPPPVTPTRTPIPQNLEVAALLERNVAPRLTATYAPQNPAYRGRTIDELVAREYGSNTFDIIRTISDEGSFMRYEFVYPSDELNIHGFMNVPHEGTEFPVAVVLHGYVDVREYELVPYTRRYADALAEAGYMVLHPNYRDHPPSDYTVNYNTFRVDYAVDVLNLLATVQNVSRDIAGPLRRANEDRVYLMGHSMGGGIAQRVMTVRPSWMRAVVLYGSMSGDERRNYNRIKDWAGPRNWEREANASDEMLRAVSPVYYIGRWQAPVSVHHGSGDNVVPPVWSAELCELLRARSHPVACFVYKDWPHTFFGGADELFMNRMISFFERY